MRYLPLLLLLAILAACDRQPALTPDQQAQVDANRTATVMTVERLLDRPLTDSERRCIVIDLKDGRITGRIESPLAETLEQRQAHLLKQHSPPATAP